MTNVTDKLAYFDFPSKVTTYIVDDTCILIDAGLDAKAGKKVVKELNIRGVRPEVLILTHAHADHFGGARELKKAYPTLRVMATALDKPIFEQPVYEPYYLYSAVPLKELQNKFVMGESIEINELLQPGGSVELLGERWEVVDLAGHTPGQIGLVTPERILLTADAFFPEEVVAKYRLLYHFDLEGALGSLQRLEQLALSTQYQTFLPGHGGPYTSLQSVLISNLQAIHETVELIQLHIAETPRTREEVVAHVMQQYQIHETIPQYFLTLSSVSAYLSYLARHQIIVPSVQNGQLSFTLAS